MFSADKQASICFSISQMVGNLLTCHTYHLYRLDKLRVFSLQKKILCTLKTLDLFTSELMEFSANAQL